MKMKSSIVWEERSEQTRIFTPQAGWFSARFPTALALILVLTGCSFFEDTNYNRNEPVRLSPLEVSREQHRIPPQTVALAAFESGDLLFRRGRGRESWFITRLYPRSPYSHVGIVVVQDRGISVVHVVPGRHTVIEEPIESFLSSQNAVKASLYRLRGENLSSLSLDIRIEQVIAAARHYVRERVRFDDAFDIHTANELYCTELVWRAYRAAGIDLMEGQKSQTWIPGCPSPCLLPSRLLRSRHLVKKGAVMPLQSAGSGPDA